MSTPATSNGAAIDAAAPVLALMARAKVRLWTLTSVMAAAALLLYFFGVRPLASFATPFSLPLPVLAALFAAAEWWRVYLHFRRSAHSLSLSEIPLVIGLFLVAPAALVPVRLAGAAFSFGAIRRQPPIKLAFNLSLFAVESSLAIILVHWLVPVGSPVGVGAWLAVLGVVGCTSLFSAATVQIAISVADGPPKHRDIGEGLGVALIGGLGNAGIALEVVAVAHRDPIETLLLVVPIAALVVAYAAYGSERQKHQQMQHLYRSRALLQPKAGATPAIPALLQQLCEVFRAAMAQVTILPDGPREPMVVITVRDGEVIHDQERLDPHVLDELMELTVPVPQTLILGPVRGREPLAESLRRRRCKDAMVTGLHVEGRLIGTLVVADRLGDVSSFDAEDAHLLETLAAQTSVSLEKWRLDDRLKHQAFHDALTGLANRTLFTTRVAHALGRRVPAGRVPAAILFIDLDDFKMVNDSLGHAAGDLLLQAVTQRLRDVVRPFDTPGRIGGDEFAVLLEDLEGPEEALAVAERIVEALRESFMIREHEVPMHASIGVSIANSDSISPDEFLRQADVAMYRAKERGKATIEIFEESMQRAVEHRLKLKTELERALLRDELFVQYQPVVALDRGELVGVEALIRWYHPEHGLMSPVQFIPLAESTGLIVSIGQRVLRTACEQTQRWNAEHPGSRLWVSVNVSPRQLLHSRFIDDIRDVIRDTGIDPSLLRLEITESLLVDGSETTLARLQAVNDLGVSLSIDDFGTGYSSLGALKILPVDTLKIPKPFIDNIVGDPRDRAFVAAIISLGTTLGLTLVAEGVETSEQRDHLRDLHCELAQGYFFAPPLDVDGITALLQQETRLQRRPAPGGFAPGPLRVVSWPGVAEVVFPPTASSG